MKTLTKCFCWTLTKSGPIGYVKYYGAIIDRDTDKVIGSKMYIIYDKLSAIENIIRVANWKLDKDMLPLFYVDHPLTFNE